MRNRNDLTLWKGGFSPLERFFDDFWSPASLQQAERSFTPAVDVKEEEDHYELSLEVPGIPKDQIQIEVIDNQLVVSGERRQEEKKSSEGQWYTERRYGRFQRSFTLPKGVSADRIQADYEHGVLHLTVPKAEAAKPRQIQIGEGRGKEPSLDSNPAA